MALILLLVLVAGVSVWATTRAILHDGRGQLPPPASRRTDDGFAPPSALLHR